MRNSVEWSYFSFPLTAPNINQTLSHPVSNTAKKSFPAKRSLLSLWPMTYDIAIIHIVLFVWWIMINNCKICYIILYCSILFVVIHNWLEITINPRVNYTVHNTKYTLDSFRYRIRLETVKRKLSLSSKGCTVVIDK